MRDDARQRTHRGALAVLLTIALPACGCTAAPSPEAGSTLDNSSMTQLRIAGWKLLQPFTKSTSGLPSPSDPEQWIPGMTLLPDNSRARGASEGFLLEADLMSVDKEPTLWEATFFNKVASSFINTPPKLNRWETTDELVQARLLRGIEFPRDSKVVKTFWYRVGSEPVNVRVWDWHKIDAGMTQVLLETLPIVCVEREPKASSGCLKAAEAFDTATLAPGDVDNFSCGNPCGGERAKAGDFMILVAMHIATKATPEWLWATYWWRDAQAAPQQPWPSGKSWTCVDAQRKEAIGTPPPPWSNYSMDVTASFRRKKPDVDPQEKCGEPGQLGTGEGGKGEQKIAMYNPFVEARFPNGLKSSCVHCHAVVNTNVYLKASPVPDVGQPMKGVDLRDFEGHLRLDYLWSLQRSLKRTRDGGK